MTASVNLDRWLFLGLLTGAVACSQQPVAPSHPVAPAVGTTQLTSAGEAKDESELGRGSADEAPRVGKPQHDEPDADVDEELPSKVEPARRNRRPGGGFSGYK